jgi:CDP-glucose 4,6-dehydratase
MLASIGSIIKPLQVQGLGMLSEGGDWSEDRLLPDIVRALHNEEEIALRNPSAVRPWQHVLEPLLGYMQLALVIMDDVARYSGAWNFGPVGEDNLSVKELTNIAVGMWGKGVVKLSNDTHAPHEARLLKLDISKAIGELKWTPRMRASEAIKRTIQWYRSFYNGSKATTLVDGDLKYYQSLFN